MRGTQDHAGHICFSFYACCMRVMNNCNTLKLGFVHGVILFFFAHGRARGATQPHRHYRQQLNMCWLHFALALQHLKVSSALRKLFPPWVGSAIWFKRKRGIDRNQCDHFPSPHGMSPESAIWNAALQTPFGDKSICMSWCRHLLACVVCERISSILVRASEEAYRATISSRT